MKQPEYIEGPKARGNFERGMIALFKVPEGKERGRETHRPEEKNAARAGRGLPFPACLRRPVQAQLGRVFLSQSAPSE